MPAGTRPTATTSAVAWSARPAQLDQVLPARRCPARTGLAAPAGSRTGDTKAPGRQGRAGSATRGPHRPASKAQPAPTTHDLEDVATHQQALAFRATRQILHQRRPQPGGLLGRAVRREAQQEPGLDNRQMAPRRRVHRHPPSSTPTPFPLRAAGEAAIDPSSSPLEARSQVSHTWCPLTAATVRQRPRSVPGARVGIAYQPAWTMFTIQATPNGRCTSRTSRPTAPAQATRGQSRRRRACPRSGALRSASWPRSRLPRSCRRRLILRSPSTGAAHPAKAIDPSNLGQQVA